MFDRVCDTIECDKVTIDDFDGAYRATNYLIRERSNSIAFCQLFLEQVLENSVNKDT